MEIMEIMELQLRQDFSSLSAQAHAKGTPLKKVPVSCIDIVFSRLEVQMQRRNKSTYPVMDSDFIAIGYFGIQIYLIQRDEQFGGIGKRIIIEISPGQPILSSRTDGHLVPDRTHDSGWIT